MRRRERGALRLPDRGAIRELILFWGPVLFMFSASVARAFMTEPLGTADETAHIDYALQVWRGGLPVFEKGLEFAPPFGVAPPVQWVAQHPPLYYVLIAPVVGPLIETGHVYGAVIGARLVNAVLAALTIAAVRWTIGVAWPTERRLATVAALVASLTGMVILVGGAAYNDLLSILCCTLALGLSALVLRRGVTTRPAIAMVGVAAAGMSSRLSFAVFLGVMVVAVVLGAARDRSRTREAVARAAVVLSLVVVPAIVSGWFYVRNIVLTGGITGGHPDWAQANLDRNERGASEVVADPNFWKGLFSVFRLNSEADATGRWILLLVPLVGVIVAVAGLFVSRRRRPATADILVLVMFVAVVLVVVAMQVNYVMTGGAPNTRYALPLLAPLSALLALGLTSWSRASTAAVVAWAVGAYWLYATSYMIPELETRTTWGDALKWVAFGLSTVVIGGFCAAYIVEERKRRRAPSTEAARLTARA